MIFLVTNALVNLMTFCFGSPCFMISGCIINGFSTEVLDLFCTFDGEHICSMCFCYGAMNVIVEGGGLYIICVFCWEGSMCVLGGVYCVCDITSIFL